MTKKQLMVWMLMAWCTAAAAQLRPWDPACYRLNQMQPHDRIVPEGDWERSLDGMWIDGHGDTVPVPNALPLRDSVTVLSRTFTLPGHWHGRRTVLKFAAAGPALVVSVNGREAGYTVDSKSPAEWDITRLLRPGTNRLEARLLRSCAGSRLEEELPPGGITRSVTLYSLPTTYISDVKVTADLDPADYRTGRLDLLVDLSREVQGGTVEAWLTAPCREGRCDTVAHLRRRLASGDWDASLAATVPDIRPWCDTAPTLYTLTLRLLDPAGRETERLVKRIGFRRVEVLQGLLCLNGKPLELRGINRPERSALGGQHPSHEEMRRVATLLKGMGVNAVRTPCYPADEYWYDLCDSLGLYLWDEANIQTSDSALTESLEWVNPVLYRVYNMYRRDRNHPSVIVWSLGRFAHNGHCAREAYRFLKGKDNTRPVVLPGVWNVRATDLASPPNLSPWLLTRLADKLPAATPCLPADLTPLGGSLDDHWRAILRHPRLQGAFFSGFEAGDLKALFSK